MASNSLYLPTIPKHIFQHWLFSWVPGPCIEFPVCIPTWIPYRHLTFNLSKTEPLIFSPKCALPHVPHIFVMVPVTHSRNWQRSLMPPTSRPLHPSTSHIFSFLSVNSVSNMPSYCHLHSHHFSPSRYPSPGPLLKSPHWHLCFHSCLCSICLLHGRSLSCLEACSGLPCSLGNSLKYQTWFTVPCGMWPCLILQPCLLLLSPGPWQPLHNSHFR